MSKISYKPGSKGKAIVRELLEVTGKGEGRNNKSSDYNLVRGIAAFGNKTGFLTAGQQVLLGKMYNRVMREIGSRKTSWRNIH